MLAPLQLQRAQRNAHGLTIERRQWRCGRFVNVGSTDELRREGCFGPGNKDDMWIEVQVRFIGVAEDSAIAKTVEPIPL